MEKLQALTKTYNSDELLSKVFDLALNKLDPSKKATRNSKRASKGVSALSKKKLYLRSGGVCEYKNCDEQHFLEIEHVIPRALGGANDFSNLKLFCKSHNQQAAINVFGQKTMDRFIN